MDGEGSETVVSMGGYAWKRDSAIDCGCVCKRDTAMNDGFGCLSRNETLLSMDQGPHETPLSMDVAPNETLLSMDLVPEEAMR